MLISQMLIEPEPDRLVAIANEIRSHLMARAPGTSTDPTPHEIGRTKEYLKLLDERGTDPLTFLIRITKLWNATAQATLSPEQLDQFDSEVCGLEPVEAA